MSEYESESLPETYLDRNQAVILLAKFSKFLGFKVGIRDRDKEYPILTIIFPNGQVSWHIPKHELSPILDFPDMDVDWDGHDLVTKRTRMMNLNYKPTIEILQDLEISNIKKCPQCNVILKAEQTRYTCSNCKRVFKFDGDDK